MGRFSTQGVVPLQANVEFGGKLRKMTGQCLKEIQRTKKGYTACPIDRVVFVSSLPFLPAAAGWTSKITLLDKVLQEAGAYIQHITFTPHSPNRVRLLAPGVMPRGKHWLPYALTWGGGTVVATGFYKNGQVFSTETSLRTIRAYTDGTFTAR